MQDLPQYDRLAMGSFLVSGALSICFGLFSVLGTLMGGLMALSVLVTGEEEGLIGLLLLVFYGVWMAVCLVVGSFHLWAAMQLFHRRPKGTWLWVAAASGLSLSVTMYCAPFGLISGILGVMAMINAPPEDAA